MEFSLLHDWVQGGHHSQRNIVKEGIITGDGTTTSVDASFFGLKKVTRVFWLLAGDEDQLFVGRPNADGTTITFFNLVADTAGDDEIETHENAPADDTEYRVTVFGE